VQTVATIGRQNRPLDLSGIIPDAEWPPNRAALESVRAHGLRFALGGGLAFSAYSGRWRNTKDTDLFVLPEDRERARLALEEAGFTDYYAQEAYDRTWIYRGFRDGVIIDIIWTMPSHRMVVDETWLTCGQEVTLNGIVLRLLPPEALIWAKLYVLQHDRTDWPDLLNILYAQAPKLDWARVLRQLGEDALLLGGLLNVFRWLCPGQAQTVPDWVWESVGLCPTPPAASNAPDGARNHLLDTRDWFGPSLGRKERC